MSSTAVWKINDDWFAFNYSHSYITLTLHQNGFCKKPPKFVLQIVDINWEEKARKEMIELITVKAFIIIIIGNLRGHSSNVHSTELPSLLQSCTFREWVQWAKTGSAQTVQLDQSGNTLSESSQIFTGKREGFQNMSF